MAIVPSLSESDAELGSLLFAPVYLRSEAIRETDTDS
jgi:hypothetical protein